MEFIDNVKKQCIDNGNVPIQISDEEMQNWWEKFKEGITNMLDRDGNGQIEPFSKDNMPDYLKEAIDTLEGLKESGTQITKKWYDKFVESIDKKIDREDKETAWVSELTEDLKKRYQDFKNSDIVQNTIDKIESAYENSLLQKYVEMAKEKFGPAYEKGKEMGEATANWIKDKVNDGKELGENAADWLKGKFTVNKIGLENAKDRLPLIDSPELEAKIDSIVKNGKEIFIGASIGGVGGAIAGATIGNIDFKEKFQELAEKSKTTYEQLIEKAKPYWDQAIDNIEKTYEKVFDKEIDLNQLMADGKEKAKEIGQDVKEFGQAVISDITPTIDLAKKEFNEHIVEPFKNHDGSWKEKAIDGFDPIVDWFKETGSKTVDEIKDQTQFWKDYDGNIFEKIQDGLKPIGENIQNLGESAWNKFQQTATWDQIEPVYEAAKNKIEPIVDWAKEAGDKTIDEIKDQAQYWKDHDGNIFEKARDGFEPIGQKIQDFGENAIDKFKEWGGQAKDWGEQAINSVKDWFDRG